MKFNRQHLLLGVLVLMGILRAGDYVLTSVIQGPLQQLRGENNELEEELEKRQKLLAETREAGLKIESWQKRSLPTNIETARSLYRNWLLELLRSAKLQNAVVDSGTPKTQRGLYRTMPFSAQARGNLDQITTALYQFEKSNQLHRITSLRLTPIKNSGYFDLSISAESLMIPGNTRTSINKSVSTRLAFENRRDYDIIARDNIFGIGVSHQDPLKLTILSAITFRNGKPTVWITEQIGNKVHKLANGDQFDTTALSGQISQVFDKQVVIESGELRLTLTIGQSFADAINSNGS